MGDADDLKADPLRWMLALVERRLADAGKRARVVDLRITVGTAAMWIAHAREMLSQPAPSLSDAPEGGKDGQP